MALLTHSGAGSTDLGSVSSTTGTYTKREDVSDLLLASLVPENNLLGLIDVGPEIGDTTCRWEEDRLNANTITDTTAASIAAGATTINVSAADGAVVEVGWILTDTATPLGEQIQITAIAGGALTVIRGYGGTSATSHAASAVYEVANSPTYENSDLGRDMSRARLTKSNMICRYEMNVNISREQIIRAQSGYAPGVPDELEYQFEQRLRELLRRMNKSLVISRTSTGNQTTALTGDYSTQAGLVAWLDGTMNTTAVPVTAGGTFTDTTLNSANKTLFRNGANPDWVVTGVNGAENLGKLYNDRIRLEQNDRGRGFWAKYFDTTLGNTLRIVADAAVYDTAGIGLCFLLDSGRIRIRPFKDSFFIVIQAPSFRDGDAVRAIASWTTEVRNTGTDVGAAHSLMTALTF